jgi:hypothetical protein
MGLLDGLLPQDPEQRAAVTRGLLSAGLQLMQARGKFLPALGQGGMAGLGGFEQERQRQLQAKRIGLQDELLKGNIEEQKRQAELTKLPNQFYRAPSTPAVDATGGMETAVEAPQNASGPGGFDLPGYIQALMGKNPVQALQLQASLQKAPTKLGKDDRLLEPGTNRVLVDALPTKEDESPIARLIKERDKFPIGDPTRRIFDEAIKKASTHQPGVSVSYGAPVAGVNEKGESIFFQPGKGGGAPAIVPGVRPPKDPNALKLGEAQKKQVAGIDALSSAVDEYTKELSTFPLTGVINPTDRARIGTKYNNMMLQAKEAYNLGVLNGPDYQILQSVVADPVSLKGFTTSNRSLANQANELKRMMQQVKGQLTKTEGKAEDNDPLGLRK